MIRVLEHFEPIYASNYVMLYGTVEDVRTYGETGDAKSLERAIANGLLEDSSYFRGRYMHMEHGLTGIRYHIIFIRSDVSEQDRIIVAAHETLHATFSVLLERGMNLSNDSEEAFTYHQGHLLELAMKLMKMDVKKKRRTRRRKK